MKLRIGNAPCSWGVEFADDPRNPPWELVLDETLKAGYEGIELGPIGFMPEDPAQLGDALKSRGLTLIGGVVFRPFHDPAAWDQVQNAVRRTCKSLAANEAPRVVLIDSIAAERAPTAGRPAEARRLKGAELSSFQDRLRSAAKIGAEEFGLTVSLHAHAAGFVEFADELERMLDAIDASLLKICLDTGHCIYAGFDPIAFYTRYSARVEYLHFKDIDPAVRAHVVANQIGFYDACGQGLFCILGKGEVDFAAFKAALIHAGFSGWGTVEQDCDPAGATLPSDDARVNLEHLRSVGLAS